MPPTSQERSRDSSRETKEDEIGLIWIGMRTSGYQVERRGTHAKPVDFLTPARIAEMASASQA